MDAPSVANTQFTREAVFWSDNGTATVRCAAVGEEIRIWLSGRRWRKNDEGGTMVCRKVQSLCNDPAGGHWLCVTHQEHLVVGSELQKHLSTGSHNLVWFCYQHGPEMKAAK
jgi:hypothetical protein